VNKILVGLDEYSKQQESEEEDKEEVIVDADVNMEGGVM
jgi:hypothetical protein